MSGLLLLLWLYWVDCWYTIVLVLVVLRGDLLGWGGRNSCGLVWGRGNNFRKRAALGEGERKPSGYKWAGSVSQSVFPGFSGGEGGGVQVGWVLLGTGG